ncbi:MAG: NUDIX domain-containing protein [Candidatus Lokiarchaeota archaeon]|nr:NUDIX domain-containing protein [Candidatus Lokiarchaeota archaeon]
MEFIYKEEFWFISTFLNTSLVEGGKKSQEIEKQVRERLSNLKKEDIYYKIRDEIGDNIIEMAKQISISCKWIPYLENFPYEDENSQKKYDTLGFFQFDVEYYKNEPSKKESIKSSFIQQIPQILLAFLKNYSTKEENIGIIFDLESPIYVFVTSNKTKPECIEWTQENIDKFKKIIGYWTEIYSGQWEDYSETLYDRRIESNLSNRLSELHFIRRNSGFIYMAEENYENFFESYMKEFVLIPTPRMRAVLFALRLINESLDLLFLKTQTEEFKNVEAIEDKIKNLRLLRGLIQTNLSVIYNELDYNRRQHYTTVLKHLLYEFEIENIVNRINEKFNIIYDSMHSLYNKKNEEIQKRTEKGLNLLNLLFGAGILADLGGVIMLAVSIQEGDFVSIILNSIIAIIISGILITTILFNIYMRYHVKESKISKTVDAVIEDTKGNIVLIKRKYPPFQGFYALPGGFIETGEKPQQALLREVKEETNLNVKIIGKIGIFDEEGRDPRGIIHSTAYKCLVDDTSNMRSGDDSKEVELISKERLKDLELAFDHKKIIKESNIFD